jgi:hypothetical protein
MPDQLYFCSTEKIIFFYKFQFFLQKIDSSENVNIYSGRFHVEDTYGKVNWILTVN